MTNKTKRNTSQQQRNYMSIGGEAECTPLGSDDQKVRLVVTVPHSLRAELFLAFEEIIAGKRTREELLELDHEKIRAAAMQGLQILTETLEMHSGTGQTRRIVRFLAALYNGYDHSFDLVDLRGLDTELANACLAYLNFDRLGIAEVHTSLPGGAEQLHRWLVESGCASTPERPGPKAAA